MFYLQTQLIPNPSSPERNDEAPLAPCLNSLPIQETGHMVNQHSTTNGENHASFVQEPDTNLHLEDFGGELIAMSEDDTGQIEVLIFTTELTPAIVET